MFEAEVKDGRVEVPEQWPEGAKVRMELVSEPEPKPDEPTHVKIGLDESEWDDSPEGRLAWNAWLDTIEPIDFPEPDAYDEMNRQYNLDAMRKQWENGFQ